MSAQELDTLAVRLPDNPNKILLNMGITVIPFIILIHKMLRPLSLEVGAGCLVGMYLVDKALERVLYSYASRSSLFT